MAKTRTVTRHRKQMLVIAGMICINIWTSLAISGKEVSVRRVLRPLTALRAEIELSPPMKIVTHDRLTIEKSMMFHPSRRYEYGYRTKPNAKILRRHSTVYMIWKVYSSRSKIGDLSGQWGFGSTAICTQLATIVNMMNCSNHLARRMLYNLERKGAVAPQVIPQNWTKGGRRAGNFSNFFLAPHASFFYQHSFLRWQSRPLSSDDLRISSISVRHCQSACISYSIYSWSLDWIVSSNSWSYSKLLVIFRPLYLVF